MTGPRTLRVAVGGLGTIGTEVARRLGAGIHGLALAAVSARDRQGARQRLAAAGLDVPVLALGSLPEHADVVVECAPASVFRELAEPAVRAGRTVVTVSAAGLLEHLDLVDMARVTGARLLVPSGALLGLDAVRSAAEGQVETVRMITRKPPSGLAGAPGVEMAGITDLEGLTEPVCLFEGSAAEGARRFPANVNVAAALGLAGVGVERTRLEVWAVPGLERNCHEIRVEADSAVFEMRIENVPSESNPRTGRIVAQSVVATLRNLGAPLAVGV